jgi:hypothetical protein
MKTSLGQFFKDDLLDFETTTTNTTGQGGSWQERDDRAARARSILADDERENEHDFFERERGIFEDRRGITDPSQIDRSAYDVGTSRKRKNARLFKRNNEIVLDGKTGGVPDFDSSQNKFYEDAHALLDERQKLLEDFKDPKKQKNMKTALEDLVAKRSAQATRTVDRYAKDSKHRAKVDNNTDAGAGEDGNNKGVRDKNDYDWVLSGARDPYDPYHVGSLASGKEEDFVTETVQLQQGEDDWIKSRLEPLDGGEEDASNPTKKESSKTEIIVSVPKREIEHVQALTSRLYGVAVGEAEYVASIRAKIVASASRGGDAVSGGVVEEEEKNKKDPVQQQIEREFQDYITSGTDNYSTNADDMQIESYGNSWQQALDADSERNILPEIEWNRTVFARFSPQEVLAQNPFSLIIEPSSIELLLEDDKTFAEFESQTRRARYCDEPDKHVFTSMKAWGKRYARCDIVHRKTASYNASYRKKEDSGGGKASEANWSAVTEQRIVTYHDMKNGFFVANHFVLSKDQQDVDNSTPSSVQQSKYIFIWIGHVYLQYLNSFQ